jgi:uncharacterized protein YsxB (DUF464 family)
MILVRVSDNLIKISGHANYSDGNDIVCASVSSIMYTTVNAIMSFDKDAIIYEDNNDVVTIKNIKKDEITNKLIDNMINLFDNLKNDYPKNINIIEED